MKANELNYRTKAATPDDIKRAWHIVDAKGMVLGRMCTKIASILKGKNKPYYTPHMDCGDYVVIINADKVKMTGSKMEDKVYTTYSGYPGGQKTKSPKELMAKRPTAVVENAVRGMLPKTRLGRQMFRKAFFYAGPDHEHQAQNPQELKID